MKKKKLTLDQAVIEVLQERGSSKESVSNARIEADMSCPATASNGRMKVTKKEFRRIKAFLHQTMNEVHPDALREIVREMDKATARKSAQN